MDYSFVRSLLLPFLLFVVFVSLLILCCFHYSSCLSLPFHFSLVSSLLFSLSLLFLIFFVLCLLCMLSASPLKPSSATSLCWWETKKLSFVFQSNHWWLRWIQSGRCTKHSVWMNWHILDGQIHAQIRADFLDQTMKETSLL